MSSTLNPAEALSSIPGWNSADSSWHELRGGLTNRSYLVERGNESFVLRLDAEHTAAFNLDRISEIDIIKRAAVAGLAPEVVFADSGAGILLCHYVSGKAWTVADLADDAKLEALAGLLRLVHDLPPSGVEFDPNSVARRYTQSLEARPGLHAFASRCEQIIAAMSSNGEFFCCHNDVVAANVIADPKLKLLDWEYACDNDPMFDLASLIGFHNLGPERQSVLLSAYAGGHDSELAERLEIQVRLYDAIQWLWLANRQMITRSSAQAARLEELQQRIV